MFSESCNFLEVYASAANDSRMRTKRGKQHHYKKRKQIRYLNILNILNTLTLLSADAKSAILLRVPSLTKVEVGNFLWLHFMRWFYEMILFGYWTSLGHVKKSVKMLIPMLLSLRYSTIVSFNLSSTFFITEIPLKTITVLYFYSTYRNVPKPS